MPGPTRRALLRAAAAAPLAWSLRGWRESKSPRNVLVLIADDLGRGDLGCYGNPKSATPTIDALAASGSVVARAYTPTGICQPSRSCLFTGLYPHKNGAIGFGPIDSKVATWPELLTPQHCATALIGKVGVEPADKFRFEFLIADTDPKFGSDRDAAAYEKHFETFLELAGERRFCALIAFKDPHRPFDKGGRPSNSRAPSDVVVPPYLVDTFATRVEFAAYTDAIARLDAAVAKVLGVLARRKLDGDTLVLFTSDNGPPFPFAKSTLYEAGIALPLVARWPGVAKPRESTAFVNLVDLLPTALDAFGVEAPKLDGVSLLPFLRGEAGPAREHSIGAHESNRDEVEYPMRSLRHGDTKYVLNFHPERFSPVNAHEVGKVVESWQRESDKRPEVARRLALLTTRPREELYDLAHDPCELENLAAREDRAELLKHSRELLLAWMHENADPRTAEWPFEH